VRENASENWEAYRRRLVAETERFIEWGLKHPEQVNWIPAKPMTDGGFPRKVASWFYQTVLTGEADSQRMSWRKKLRLGIRLRQR